MSKETVSSAFSPGDITGPITFGEVAYQLLNQTMVYLTITELASSA